MIAFNRPIPVVVLARAAYLRAGGLDWKQVAEKLGRTKTETEAMELHADWLRLYRLAARTVAREVEADARQERRLALRSLDEGEAAAAAKMEYAVGAGRLPRGETTPTDPFGHDRLVREYLDCLNAMSVEEFLTHEAAANAEPRDPTVTSP